MEAQDKTCAFYFDIARTWHHKSLRYICINLYIVLSYKSSIFVTLKV
jgi:hypothetical protein